MQRQRPNNKESNAVGLSDTSTILSGGIQQVDEQETRNSLGAILEIKNGTSKNESKKSKNTS